MASIGGSNGKINSSYDSSVNYTVPLVLMVSLFFMIGFITVLNDVLIPSLKDIYDLTESQAMLVQVCFFGAYGVMSIPSGFLIQKIGYKKGLIISLCIICLGLLMFWPASHLLDKGVVISYGFYLFSFFIIASGLTILQVAINPYIVALGPDETGASRLNFGGALNSTATTIGPIVGAAYFLSPLLNTPALKAEALVGPYFVLAIVILLMCAVLYFVKLPSIHTEEVEISSSEKSNDSIWNYSHVLYGAGAIFFYVGAEVAIGSILVLYIKSQGYLKASPEDLTLFGMGKLASSLVAYYWGGAMIGRAIGSAIGQKIKAQKLLAFVSIAAMVLVGLGVSEIFHTTWIQVPVLVIEQTPLFVNVSIPVGVFFFVLVGLFNSVMWPCIFPLSLSGLGKLTSQGSGILVTMVVGGAAIPYFQGKLVEWTSYEASFVIVLACYAYILYFAVKGYKIKDEESVEEKKTKSDSDVKSGKTLVSSEA